MPDLLGLLAETLPELEAKRKELRKEVGPETPAGIWGRYLDTERAIQSIRFLTDYLHREAQK